MVWEEVVLSWHSVSQSEGHILQSSAPTCPWRVESPVPRWQCTPYSHPLYHPHLQSTFSLDTISEWLHKSDQETVLGIGTLRSHSEKCDIHPGRKTSSVVSVTFGHHLHIVSHYGIEWSDFRMQYEQLLLCLVRSSCWLLKQCVRCLCKSVSGLTSPSGTIGTRPRAHSILGGRLLKYFNFFYSQKNIQSSLDYIHL